MCALRTLSRPPATPRLRLRGVTLLELTFALVISGLLAAIALPAYGRYVERARVTQAISGIAEISARIERVRSATFRLPASLAEVGADQMRDPWGNAYVYLPFTPTNRGARRKDRALVPINSDFDLYSIGRDRRTRPPLTVPVSHDDIVRARDGNFLGKASDF